jgi:hypothetical protein
MLAGPCKKVLVWGQIAMDAVEIGRNQIARQVTAIQFTFFTITDGPLKAELQACGVHERQRFSGHEWLVSRM